MLKQNNPTKENYLKPQCEIIITEAEGFICTSNVNVSSTKIQEFEDGGSCDISVF